MAYHIDIPLMSLKGTQEEQDIIQTYLTSKKLRKKEYLLQETDVCKYIAFVEKVP